MKTSKRPVIGWVLSSLLAAFLIFGSAAGKFTDFVGAILLTAYMGGAVVTHVRVGEPFFAPIIIAIVTWIALGLRKPEVFSLAFGSCCSPGSNHNNDST